MSAAPPSRRTVPRRFPRQTALLAAGVLALANGCAFPSAGRDGLGPVAARMRAAYPDLASGRFVILADFESAPEAKLFRLASADADLPDERQPVISILRSRGETGAGGLRVRFERPDETLWFDARRSDSLALLPDWRPYALLIFSIHGPDGGATVDFAIHGNDPGLSWKTPLRIGPGWNLYRIDLAEAGEVLDLSSVRGLSWRAAESDAPVELHFDDFVLTDNTTPLVAASDQPDALHAFVRGRRLYVGVTGRFELAFADGLLVGWYAPGDPEGSNLTLPSGMGPWPLALDEGWTSPERGPVAYDDAATFAAWGTRTLAGQAATEATTFRVVVRGQWRFVDDQADPRAAGADRPSITWRYVVYPSGAVYVNLRCDVAGATWPGALLGAAVALDGRRGFRHLSTSPVGASDAGGRCVLLARPGRDEADLLWAPARAELCASQLTLETADGARLAAAVGALPAEDAFETAHLLRVWPHDLDALEIGRSLADDYRRPVKLVPAAGTIVNDAAGDLDHDGFNESEGCYEVSAPAGVLRFAFDPRGVPRHHPVFRVHETAGRRCWVYLDGRAVASQGRDAQDRLLFALPPTASRSVWVEVNAPAP